MVAPCVEGSCIGSDVASRQKFCHCRLCVSVAAAAEDGDIKVHMLHEAHKIYVHEEHKYPKTVAGYFINYDGKRVQIKPEEWLINVNTGVAGHITGNEHMPDNLYLFCGDTALNLLVDPLTRLAGGVGNSYK